MRFSRYTVTSGNITVEVVNLNINVLMVQVGPRDNIIWSTVPIGIYTEFFPVIPKSVSVTILHYSYNNYDIVEILITEIILILPFQ